MFTMIIGLFAAFCVAFLLFRIIKLYFVRDDLRGIKDQYTPGLLEAVRERYNLQNIDFREEQHENGKGYRAIFQIQIDEGMDVLRIAETLRRDIARWFDRRGLECAGVDIAITCADDLFKKFNESFKSIVLTAERVQQLQKLGCGFECRHVGESPGETKSPE